MKTKKIDTKRLDLRWRRCAVGAASPEVMLMSSSNRGRSATGEAAVPYYLSMSCREAAKHLRLTVSRYLADRATIGDVEEASRMMLHTVADEDPVTIH